MARRVPIKVALGERAAAFYRREAEKREMTLAAYLASLLQELAVAEVALTLDLGAHARVTPVVSVARQESARQESARQESARPPTTRPMAASGYKGVYRYGKRWAAVLWIDGRQERLGAYDTAEEAARAYDAAAREKFGSAADVNFPDDDVEPYVEKLATDTPLSDIEWRELQRRTGSSTSDAPLAIESDTPRVPSAPIRLYPRSPEGDHGGLPGGGPGRRGS